MALFISRVLLLSLLAFGGKGASAICITLIWWHYAGFALRALTLEYHSFGRLAGTPTAKFVVGRVDKNYAPSRSYNPQDLSLLR